MKCEPPRTFQELRALLQHRFPEFADGQQRIARLVLDDPEGTAFRSISESADLAGVHRSSLVRFATMLGLSGYPELKQLCRAQFSSHTERTRSRVGRHTPNEEFFTAVTERDNHNIARTFDQIDRDEWNLAVQALATSSTVHIIGLRACISVAHQAAHLLRMVRPKVRQISATAGLLVDELRDITPDDALIAVSIRRYAKDTVHAMEWAQRRGATTIALTDDPSSPLARVADLTFYVETSGVSPLQSLTALTSVAQALATAVALRLGPDSREDLILDEQLLEEFAVYDEHRGPSGRTPYQLPTTKIEP